MNKKQYLFYKKRCNKYKVGLGFAIKYGFWKSLFILKKYKYCCNICKSKKDLTFHHKDRKGRNYVNIGLKANNDVSNIEVLCRRCHGSIHGKQHGKINLYNNKTKICAKKPGKITKKDLN